MIFVLLVLAAVAAVAFRRSDIAIVCVVLALLYLVLATSGIWTEPSWHARR